MTDNASDILHQIAEGSLGRVIERNNRLFLIETKTVKVKNKILREFVEEARKDGFTDEEIIEILLTMDDSVEKNEVEKTLKNYI